MLDAENAAAFPLPLVTPREAQHELVSSARAGDMQAFEQLYRLNVGRVYAVCLRLCADARDAEEMTQRAFIAAWQKLHLFRLESAFSSWLHRVAVNTVLTAMRSDRRRAERMVSTGELDQLEAPLAPPAAGSRLDLEAAIAALPARARAVFVLHDVEGWTHEEIAGELGVAAGTCKAQLHRARKLLQEALQ